MRKTFSGIRSSETEQTSWLPGLKTYLTMIRCEPKAAAVNIAGAFLIFALLIFMLFISWTTIDALGRPPIRTEQRQLTPVEKAVFKERLKYHGLNKQVNVVYDFPEKPYFIRNGQKCRF